MFQKSFRIRSLILEKSFEFSADLRKISEGIAKSLEEFPNRFREAMENFRQTVSNFDPETVEYIRKALAQFAIHSRTRPPIAGKTVEPSGTLEQEQRHESL